MVEVSILSIDPGLHLCGAALWGATGTLQWAGLVKNRIGPSSFPNPTSYGYLWNGMVNAVEDRLVDLDTKPDRLVIELPQVYVRSRSKGDPNDLIQLAGVVGAFVHWHSGLTWQYTPATWKGQTPKDITEERAKKRLGVTEMNRIDKMPEKLAHNCWDAVALGLFHLGR